MRYCGAATSSAAARSCGRRLTRPASAWPSRRARTRAIARVGEPGADQLRPRARAAPGVDRGAWGSARQRPAGERDDHADDAGERPASARSRAGRPATPSPRPPAGRTATSPAAPGPGGSPSRGSLRSPRGRPRRGTAAHADQCAAARSASHGEDERERRRERDRGRQRAAGDSVRGVSDRGDGRNHRPRGDLTQRDRIQKLTEVIQWYVWTASPCISGTITNPPAVRQRPDLERHPDERRDPARGGG